MGAVIKRNGWRDAGGGTNMKGSGGWRQGDGAPPENWMKLSLYNQGASAWLPPPLPSDRWGLPLQMGFSQCDQPTSRVKQCFCSLLCQHFQSSLCTHRAGHSVFVSHASVKGCGYNLITKVPECQLEDGDTKSIITSEREGAFSKLSQSQRL